MSNDEDRIEEARQDRAWDRMNRLRAIRDGRARFGTDGDEPGEDEG